MPEPKDQTPGGENRGKPSPAARASSAATDEGASNLLVRDRSTSVASVVGRVAFLGVVVAGAIWAAPLMVSQQLWTWLVMLVLATIAILVLYSTKRFVPGKYLFPGTFFLVAFLITPIILTITYSFTNFGDGKRGTKEQAIAAIETNSVQQTADGKRYQMSVGIPEGTPVPTEIKKLKIDQYTLFVVDPDTQAVSEGDLDTPLAVADPATVTVTEGRVTAAQGFTILTSREVNALYADITQVAVETGPTTGIRALGNTQAFEGTKSLKYDAATDTIVNSLTGETWTVQKVGDSLYFVDAKGNALPQSWLQGVGADNYIRLFTDTSLTSQFAKAFGWTLAFSAGSVILTFVVGFGLALTLNDERMKSRRIYRSVLLMPYAVPGFIALLVWSNFYNKDFGLINRTLGISLDWMGDPTMAKAAVLLTNLWMGFPYMFIVSTGALQSISKELLEAARVDGASRFQATTRIVAPLLLVAVSPLLVASFAFNFNNFNAIKLLTDGGPFAAGEYTRGGTDILISMIYRAAFGGSGAQFGFASAMSVALFVLTGVLAAVQFRVTRTLEDVHG